MHALTPRHRRKAGSGPPANALIAWISTDPYLRDAATTASHRREIDVPLLSGTRSAKAAVAACFVLACAAVIGITEIVSHGRAEAQQAMAPPLLVKPRSTTAPGSPIGPPGRYPDLLRSRRCPRPSTTGHRTDPATKSPPRRCPPAGDQQPVSARIRLAGWPSPRACYRDRAPGADRLAHAIGECGDKRLHRR